MCDEFRIREHFENEEVVPKNEASSKHMTRSFTHLLW